MAQAGEKDGAEGKPVPVAEGEADQCHVVDGQGAHDQVSRRDARLHPGIGKEADQRAGARGGGEDTQASRIDLQHILGEYRKHVDEAHRERCVEQRRADRLGECFVAAYVAHALGEVVEQAAV